MRRSIDNPAPSAPETCHTISTRSAAARADTRLASAAVVFHQAEVLLAGHGVQVERRVPERRPKTLEARQELVQREAVPDREHRHHPERHARPVEPQIRPRHQDLESVGGGGGPQRRARGRKRGAACAGAPAERSISSEAARVLKWVGRSIAAPG